MEIMKKWIDEKETEVVAGEIKEMAITVNIYYSGETGNARRFAILQKERNRIVI